MIGFTRELKLHYTKTVKMMSKNCCKRSKWETIVSQITADRTRKRGRIKIGEGKREKQFTNFQSKTTNSKIRNGRTEQSHGGIDKFRVS